MAKGKLSPRQKMINLMYLVFIAMLAMQIDREVLRSFEGVNGGLEVSSRLTGNDNNIFYDNIDAKADKSSDTFDPEYLPIKERADVIKGKSKELVGLIKQYKINLDTLANYTISKNSDEVNYSALSNTDAVSKMFFNGDRNKLTDKGSALVGKLSEFVELIKSQPEANKSDLETVFGTKIDQEWFGDKFFEQPMIAGKTNLTKIQSDVITAEGTLIRQFFTNKMIDDLEVDKFVPIITVPRYVGVGENVTAIAALGAYTNDVSSGSANLNIGSYPISEGKAEFPINTSSPGKKTITGKLTFKNPNTGKNESINIDPVEYEVVSAVIRDAPTGGTITADKMNVVYIGLDNPISASLNGIDGGISMNASAGGLSGSNGKYSFKPQGGKKVTFTASGKTSSGKTVTESREFRVEPVPPATGWIRKQSSVSMPVSSLSKQTLTIGWPNFLFDLTGTVTGFKVKVPGQLTQVVNGSKLSAAKSVLGKAKKGDAVTIFDISYKDSAGNTKLRATPVTIEVK